MDNIRASEAPDSGSIPDEVTFFKKLQIQVPCPNASAGGDS